MLRLSIQKAFVTLAAMAGGIGLCLILVTCSPSGMPQTIDLQETVTLAAPMPTSQPTGLVSVDPSATDTQLPTMTPMPATSPTATPTAVVEPSPTPTISATATSTPAPSATSTPRPTATTRPTLTPGAGTAIGQAIIIDHTCTDLSKIPDHWLEEAKKLAIHYAHTSHGQQISEGNIALAERNSQYSLWIFYAGVTPTSLPDQCSNAICIYDSGPHDVTYWSTEEGRSETRTTADTGLFDVSMWSWCGQQSTNETAAVQLYLDTMRGFEEEYPDMRFILMTGHTDGGSVTLERNNNIVRQFARDNGMVLFDFADIESYDPDGNYYPNTDDSCSWCAEWCSAHPEDCRYLPDSCPHSHPFNCMTKAYAFWWMMARLAGWDGK